MVEIRDLPPTQKPDWEMKAKAYEARIAKLTQDVEWAETSAERDEGARGKKGMPFYCDDSKM